MLITLPTPCRGSLAALALLFWCWRWAWGAATDCTPINCCDGLFDVTTLAGDSAWRTRPGNPYLYFDVPGAFSFAPGSPVYVEVTYFDEGDGRLRLEYDSSLGATLPFFYHATQTHTRSSRVDSGAFVRSYHELASPALLGRQNGGADLRFTVTGGSATPLAIRSVKVQSEPFSDPRLAHVLTRPWLAPYSGPSREDVPTDSLKDKIVAGYQGWFRTPNDLADQGWVHWSRDGRMVPESFTVDQWPDLTAYCPDELVRAGQVSTRSGKPAQLFSSTSREIVRRHFQWMRQYNIDGAFLQRFATEGSSGAYGHQEWVLAHVREAAHLEGRLWAVEYDISALNDANVVEVITRDWKWLIDVVKIREDSRYAHEDGKLVVQVWGLPVPDRGISRDKADAVVDFLANDPVYGGNYVLGGFPWWWRTLTDWYEHFQRYHGTLAWMPQDAAGYRDDADLLRAWGLDYVPHVWPGFSWANLKQLTGDAQLTPRDGGQFFWQKLNQAFAASPSCIFVGMFDEYDEGTAILPMTDDPPSPPAAWGRFITNEGRPSDWWLLLTQEARAALTAQRAIGSTLPGEMELANRSNIGDEAAIDLDTVDVSSRLTRVDVGDGNTVAELAGGRRCRSNLSPQTDLYFYFNLADDFAWRESAGLDATVEVEYLDRDGSVELTLEYDSLARPYTIHPRRVVTTGSGRWRTARFELTDAYFGNRQNNGADFRVRLVQPVEVHIDRVWVRKPAPDGDSCQRRVHVRGDANGDAVVDISDAVRILFHLFAAAPLPCAAAGDLDDSGAVSITDPVALLGYLFRLGAQPPAPFPGCGLDPTFDGLDCVAYEPCA